MSKTRKIVALNEAEAEKKWINYCVKKSYRQFKLVSITKIQKAESFAQWQSHKDESLATKHVQQAQMKGKMK